MCSTANGIGARGHVNEVKMSVSGKSRRWRTFPGRNTFCLDGRIIMAKQYSVLLFTVALILGTMVLFFVFDSIYLATHLSIVIPIIGGLLTVFVFGTLFRTSFTDPGIIPRASDEESAYVEAMEAAALSACPDANYQPPPRTKDIQIKGQTLKLKYCFTCKIFRPPRASHCSLCDHCVENFDHHCPWVGNCVGKRNYRFFYLFLLSLSTLTVFVFVCNVVHIILRAQESNFLEALKVSPATVLEMLVCFFTVWSILGLAGFHTYLVTAFLTTNEDIKGSWSRKKGLSSQNPFSHGGIVSNCVAVICAPMPPSLLHLREYINDDEQNYGSTTDAQPTTAYTHYYTVYDANKPYPVQPRHSNHGSLPPCTVVDVVSAESH